MRRAEVHGMAGLQWTAQVIPDRVLGLRILAADLEQQTMAFQEHHRRLPYSIAYSTTSFTGTGSLSVCG